MIRVSAGSAACLGLATNKMDAYPTTAYFLSGNRCLMNCAFCPQGVGQNEVLNRLGRVTWPEYPWPEVEKTLVQAEKKGIRRVCLQSVRHEDGIESLLKLIARVKAITTLPLSLSAWIRDEQEAEELIDAGVDRVSVSLDVANPSAYREIKGGSLQQRLNLLFGCARNLPGRISTHIICGLGESEAEVLSLLNRLVEAGVTAALFAFIPLKGTPLEHREPPAVDSYRRIQAGYYLLREKAADFSSFAFDKERLISFGLPSNDLKQLLADGTAFQTTGCAHCNRPFYNERPGGIIYNYHRELNEEEKEASWSELVQSLTEKRF